MIIIALNIFSCQNQHNKLKLDGCEFLYSDSLGYVFYDLESGISYRVIQNDIEEDQFTGVVYGVKERFDTVFSAWYKDGRKNGEMLMEYKDGVAHYFFKNDTLYAFKEVSFTGEVFYEFTFEPSLGSLSAFFVDGCVYSNKFCYTENSTGKIMRTDENCRIKETFVNWQLTGYEKDCD